ncbi:MAG: hypothetical protein U0T69_10175 [Chitinophagales bacterium]
MKRYSFLFVFILLVSLLVNNGCKKQENFEENTTYQLDSITITKIDDAGDTSYRVSIGMKPAYLDSFISINNLFGPTFRINEDSIICNVFTNPYDLDFNYYKHIAINNKLVLIRSNSFGSHFLKNYTTNLMYNNNIDSINTFIELYDSGPAAEFSIKRKVNYHGGNISTISEGIHSYFHDTPIGDSISITNHTPTTFSYTNNYPNQKSLTGLDVNEIILDAYRDFYIHSHDMAWGKNYPNTLNSILILFNKTGISSNCTNLIEKISFDPIEYISAMGGLEYYSNFSSAPSRIEISYNFDSVYNNRMTQMHLKVIYADYTMANYIYSFIYD